MEVKEMRFQKKEIEISLRDGSTETVAAWCHGDWAYHRHISPGINQWTVTHLPTGAAAYRPIYQKDARFLTELFIEHMPVWRPKNLKKKAPLKFLKAYQKVLEKFFERRK